MSLFNQYVSRYSTSRGMHSLSSKLNTKLCNVQYRSSILTPFMSVDFVYLREVRGVDSGQVWSWARGKTKVDPLVCMDL